MIRFERIPGPAEFEERCRLPGLAWLAAHPGAERPHDFWSSFKPQRADAFGQLCAYSCMFEPVGTVDHFLSWKMHPERAYDWDNYRFASAWVNSSKRTADDEILDPFQVGDDWFEIILPSLQLVLTDAVPEAHRARAAYTLDRLHLRDDERVIRQRREWYRMYQESELSLEGLRKKAPLIARAVEKQRRGAER
jgi:hypothetical protein